MTAERKNCSVFFQNLFLTPLRSTTFDSDDAGADETHSLFNVFTNVHLPGNITQKYIYDNRNKKTNGKALELLGALFQGGDYLETSVGAPKTDPLKGVKEVFLDVLDIGAAVPEGDYKFFGSKENRAEELSVFLKTNPFMAPALTPDDDGGFELKSYDPDEENPTLYLKMMRTLSGAGRRVNFTFDSKMKVKSCTVYDDIEGMEIRKIQKDDKDINLYATSALYNLVFFASSVHATIHVFHFLLTSCFVLASEDFKEMNDWALTYNRNVAIRYEQIAELLIHDPEPWVPPNPNDPRPDNADSRALTGPDGFGSSQTIRPILKELLDMWGTAPKAEDFLSNMMNLHEDKRKERKMMEDAGILDEFLVHFDMIEEFAEEASTALNDIDNQKFETTESRLVESLKNCGEFKSCIDSVQDFIEVMSISGIWHGGTLSYSRLLICEDVLRWRDITKNKFDYLDIKIAFTMLATIAGAQEGEHVMTSTGMPFDKRLQRVLDKFDMESKFAKIKYLCKITKKKNFDDVGYILSDFCPDGFDGKQLTISSYF